jgi:Domain of unknown function (DUF5110)
VLIYPAGASRFELYEDDGRTNAYRRGRHALTVFECSTGPEAVTVRISDAVGDRSVIPAGRRYLLRLRLGPPRGVTVSGQGEVPRLAGADQTGPGLVGRRRLRQRPPPRPARADHGDAQDLKNQVSVWAMCGLSLTALFQRRDGMLPMLVLITRTP